MTRRCLAALALLLALAAVPLADAAPGHEKRDREKDHEPQGEARGHAKRAEPEAPAPTPAAEPQREAPAQPEPQAPEPAPAQPAVRAPTPIPERRLEALEQGIATESRVPLAFPNPYAPPEEGGEGRLFSPWGWALPILGLVGLGAALATTRPGSVTPAVARPRASYIVAQPTLEGMLHAGKRAVEASRFDEAVAWFTQALRLNPRLAVAHFCLGVCLAAMGRHEDAHAALRKAHRLDPQEGAYRLELARAAARTGRHQEAMQQMAPLLRLLPDLAAHADDEAFASMRDHPRWLAMLGRL